MLRYFTPLLLLTLLLPGCQPTRLQVVCKSMMHEIQVTYEGGGAAVEAE